MNTVWLMSDENGAVPALRDVIEQLDNAGGELVLDFSGVRRIDPRALGAMETLAGSADKKAVKVVLRGVNVTIYKVLKLTRLDTRFSAWT